MPQLDRTRYITEHYVHLQGLRLVPLGVLFLAAGGWHAGWLILPGGSNHASDWFVVGFWTAIALSFAIRANYERQFGRLTPLPGRSGFWPIMGMFAAVLTSLWLQNVGWWPSLVSAPLVVVALCLTCLGVTHGVARKHYLVVALAVGIVASPQVFRGLDVQREVMLDLLIGAGLIITGIGDDRLLRKLLQPPSDVYAGTV